MKLSKTNYLIWRDCPHNAWAKIHVPEIYHAKPLSTFDAALLETGNDYLDQFICGRAERLITLAAHRP